jgi:hypothetical protein
MSNILVYIPCESEDLLCGNCRLIDHTEDSAWYWCLGFETELIHTKGGICERCSECIEADLERMLKGKKSETI